MISSRSRKTRVRNPSHFGSNSQPSPEGNSSAAADNIGSSGGSKGRRTRLLYAVAQLLKVDGLHRHGCRIRKEKLGNAQAGACRIEPGPQLRQMEAFDDER